jgi:signal transduction histidine kinase
MLGPSRKEATMKKLICVVACLLAAGMATGGEKGTPEEAKALLDKAVKTVETEGDAKAIAAFNDPKGGFQDRDLYVFCLGPDNKVTAHIDPALRGTDGAAIKDADGKPIGQDIVKIREKGEGSLEYRFKNPASQKVEDKVSFLKKAGKQVCGVGAYK